MVLIDVAPETIAAKRAPSPSALNDRWRGIGRLDWVYQQRRGQTRSRQIPSGRAAGSVANHPAGPGPSYRLVSDAIVRSLPESSPLIGWIASCLRLESNQHPRCFRPLLYRFKPQRRRTTDCYGIWVTGPSPVRRTVCFPSPVSRAAGRRSCRSLSDNRLMRLCMAMYQASCPPWDSNPDHKRIKSPVF